jgi:hypothetical protein
MQGRRKRDSTKEESSKKRKDEIPVLSNVNTNLQEEDDDSVIF